ncbi:hypothetical protein PHYPSEUDO_007673 [Phytophthora pseudosyringae]|uniref:LamG-like jellyroll fold domain-containing protein n=1 Tax=Phytophthora pseudosyringae TaxID=221518 RepID=A0A8T1VGH4_9STRA|nr:hypothetical protein PHYPSEUDO_007673 [Phytophthora pseudosyringae]
MPSTSRTPVPTGSSTSRTIPFWQKRVLGHPDSTIRAPWKKEYVRSRSLLFTRAPLVPQWQGDYPITRSFAWLQPNLSTTRSQTRQFNLCTWWKRSFSFDTWFFLLSGTEDQVAGGILFGGQSDKPTSGHSPHYYQPFVIVDSKFNLRCSVLEDSGFVGFNLTPNRWYHLALTLDWGRGRQNVFLDGVNVSCEGGILHREWCLLSYQQVGAGYVRNHDDFPRRDPFGWYTFHGVVDVFRVWDGVLEAKMIELLAQGIDLREYEECVLKCTIDRAADGSAPWVNAQPLRCTRPFESKYVQLDRAALE